MPRPRPMGDARTHLMLLRTMAAETGADTAGAFDDGTLTAEDWCDAVGRCRTCRWTEGCRRFLDTPAERPRPVPRACANAALLQDLRLPG